MITHESNQCCSIGSFVRRGRLNDLPRLAQKDFSFEVTAELVEPFDGGRAAPVEQPYRKDYGFDADELAEYVSRPDGALFVAQASSGCD